MRPDTSSDSLGHSLLWSFGENYMRCPPHTNNSLHIVYHANDKKKEGRTRARALVRVRLSLRRRVRSFADRNATIDSARSRDETVLLPYSRMSISCRVAITITITTMDITHLRNQLDPILKLRNGGVSRDEISLSHSFGIYSRCLFRTF